MITESQITPTEEQKELFRWIVDQRSFPLFLVHNENQTDPAFMHILRWRDKQFRDVEGEINSEFCEEFEKVFIDWCEQNDVKWNKILRSSINVTTHQPVGVNIHQDHAFPHKNWLVYLNDFTGGGTQFYNKYNDGYKLIHETDPKKYNVVMSDGEWHSAGFPSPHEIRVVMVVTFN
jgi:hypothetical protein